MRFDAIESITTLDTKVPAPIVLIQSTSRLAALAHGLILLPATLAMLSPFALVAARAAEHPAALGQLASQPLVVLQLLAAFVFAAGLVTLAVRRLGSRLTRGARIAIDAETVRVCERGLLANRNWSAPLAGFAGVAHRVRSTLNGTRHELLLVHPDAKRSLLIEIAPRISPERIAEVCAHLRLPIFSASLAHRYSAARAPALIQTA